MMNLPAAITCKIMRKNKVFSSCESSCGPEILGVVQVCFSPLEKKKLGKSLCNNHCNKRSITTSSSSRIFSFASSSPSPSSKFNTAALYRPSLSSSSSSKHERKNGNGGHESNRRLGLSQSRTGAACHVTTVYDPIPMSLLSTFMLLFFKLPPLKRIL